MRRSRRKGQWVRVTSTLERSTCTSRFSSRSPGGAFESAAVGRGDVTTMGDGVAALDGFPGIVLEGAVFFFPPGMPADGGGVKEDLSALQGGEPGGLGIPLVPADAETGRAHV